jgi:alkylated DNA repair dioxygenase AlkB
MTDHNSLIPGLTLIENFITKAQERELITQIYREEAPWNLSLKRRTQHYGYEYQYSRGGTLKKIEEIPDFGHIVLNQIIKEGLLVETEPESFNQLIINEYLPGQGIAAHIDSNIFGPLILSVSLGSQCTMVFQHKEKKDKIEVLLKPRTLLMMEGEARTLWTHMIPGRKKDQGISRDTRVSLTFRTVDTP